MVFRIKKEIPPPMENVWLTDNVIKVHCELSTFCNAACPSCPRYFPGTHVVRAGLVLSQILISDFKTWFDVSFIKKVNEWKFCGTHGDPMMAKDVIEIVEHIYSINPNSTIIFNTNGGIRKEKDWAKLGRISSTHNLKITFSIDGLEDTNHLYRRNVSWPTLINNVKAFIDAGGYAEWDFLIFKHNEHQINEAILLSKTLGFKEFHKKRAVGFENDNQLTDIPTFNKEGNYDYSIYPPTDPDNRIYKEDLSLLVERKKHNLTEHFKLNSNRIIDEYNQKIINFVDKEDSHNIKINCISKLKEKYSEIYVNVEGIVFPCCFIGTTVDAFDGSPAGLQLKQRLSKYGIDNFDLKKHSIIDILKNNHLNTLVANTWNTPQCLNFCKQTCGNIPLTEQIYK